MKPMPGQITLYDYWLANLSYGAKCKREGYTNAYEAMPDKEGEIEVIDHEGNKFTAQAVMSFGSMAFMGSRGYDICWWRYKR